jgi:hypothetical protein
VGVGGNGSVSFLLAVTSVSVIEFSGSSCREVLISDHGFVKVQCFSVQVDVNS